MKKILSAILAAAMAVSAMSFAVMAQGGSGKKDVGEHEHQLMKMANAACHYEECTVCYELFNVGDHTFVDGKCSVCGHSDTTPEVKGEGEHEHIIIKTADEESHFDECTVCFERYGVSAHTMENGVCTVCRYPNMEPDSDEHKHVLMNMANMNSHYEECQECFELFNVGAHTFANGKCTVCGHPELVNPFNDVVNDAWYTEDVLTAVNTGLINGKGEGQFKPDDFLTYAEAVKLAACMNQLYKNGKITLANGDPWYQTYADYCKENKIIRTDYTWTDYATRVGYMYIFANALPDEAYEEINTIEDDAIPDVPSSEPFADPVYKLYRAGIVTGVDAAHNCNPTANIKRSEVAVIVARMMDPAKRKRFDMKSVYDSIIDDNDIDIGGHESVEVVIPDGSQATDKDNTSDIDYGNPSVEVTIPDGSQATDKDNTSDIDYGNPSVGIKIPGEREVIAPDKDKTEDDTTVNVLPGEQQQTGQLVVGNGTATTDPDKDKTEDDTADTSVPGNKEPTGSIISGNGITITPGSNTSQEIYLAFTIVKQPKNYEADKYGIKTELEVEVKGGLEPYKYEWYYYAYRNEKVKIKNGDYVKDADSAAPVISVEKGNTLLGNQIYCEITDAEGTKVKTDTVIVYGPFSMAVESVEIKPVEKSFDAKLAAREYVLAGRVADGRITKGDKISVVRNGKVIAIGTAADLQMFGKSLDEASKGDNIGITFKMQSGVRPIDGDIVIKYNDGHKIDTSDIVN